MDWVPVIDVGFRWMAASIVVVVGRVSDSGQPGVQSWELCSFFLSRDPGKITRNTWDVYLYKNYQFKHEIPFRKCSTAAHNWVGKWEIISKHQESTKSIQELPHFLMKKKPKFSREMQVYIVLKIIVSVSSIYNTSMPSGIDWFYEKYYFH